MAEAPGFSPREQVTRLLIPWGNGKREALDQLTPIVYSERHKLAEGYLRRERDAGTLQPTALVHEAYLRGGGAPKVSLDEALSTSPERSFTVIALDDALKALAAVDERKCQVIELRFFGGLSVEETAQAPGITVATVGREQRMAEAWLHREMSRDAQS
jgi:RNA polymerase sigma-70 factor, ECF subfamily